MQEQRIIAVVIFRIVKQIFFVYPYIIKRKIIRPYFQLQLLGRIYSGKNKKIIRLLFRSIEKRFHSLNTRMTTLTRNNNNKLIFLRFRRIMAFQLFINIL